MGSMLFRDPQALSSALAALGMLQPRAFGSLNRVDLLDLVSNYYVVPLLFTLLLILGPPVSLKNASPDQTVAMVD